MYTSEQLKRYLRGEQTVSYSDNPAPTVSEGAKAGTSDELKQYLASIHYPASEPAAAGGSFFRRAADTVKSIATPENAAYTQQMKAYDTALAGIERQMADLRDSALQEGTARYLVGEGNFTSDGSLDRYQELGAQKQAILRERENLNLAIRAVEFAKLSDSDAAKLEEILSFENWGTEDQSGYIAAQGGMSPWAQPTAEYRERESRVNQYREELKQKYNYDFLHDYYTRVRNEKKAVQEQQKWQEYVNQGPVEATLANLISVPMGLAGGALGALETAGQKVGKAFSGQTALPIDTNSQYYGLTKAANAIREQTAQNIDNGVVAFLYQTGMSGLDSLAASLVPGGAVLLATNAGTSGFLDAKARGASDDEAVAMGIANGVFEGLFESVSLGKLADTVKKAPKTFRGLVKDGLVSMGVNASEETFTEIADVLADSFIMGDLSEYNLAVKSYREAGLSEEEAKNRAARDTFGQIVTAGLGGAVMGGAFTGVGSLTGNINSRRLTQAARDYESLANANASLLGTTAETNAQQVKQVSDFLTATTADNGQTAEYTEQAVNARDNIGQWLNNLSAISESNLDQQVQSNVQALRPQLTALYNYAAEKAAAVGSSEANNYAIRRIAREMLADIRKENLPESHAENVEGFLDSVQGTGMNPDTVTQLAQLARQISLPIRADESLGDGIRAAYDADTKTIYINPNAVTTALSAAHELAHATELLEEYPEMKDYILRHAQQLYGKSLSELVAEKQEQYSARAGQALTREEAELEIVAGVFDNILTDERFLRRLYTADRGLFYRLYRFVRYQLERMSNSIRNGLANPEERARQAVLLRAQYMMERLTARLDGEEAARGLRAFAPAQQTGPAAQEAAAPVQGAGSPAQNRPARAQSEPGPAQPDFGGGINNPDLLVAELERRTAENAADTPLSSEEFYRLLDEQNARLDADRSSRRRRQYSLNEKFKDEYDAWDKKTEGKPFYIGNTSDALESVGVRDYGFYWDKSKIVKIKEKHPDMTDDVIKRVPEILENPVLIMESLTVPGRITLYGEVTDAKGIPVLVAVELSPTNRNGEILDMAKIASTYGKERTQNLIDRSTILYIDPNKNRTDNWSRAHRLQLPTGLTSYGPINTIAQRATGVNNQSMQNQAEHAQPRRKFSVAEDAEGRQIVVVEDNIFAGKEDVSKNKVVRDYIRQHIGEVKTISSDGRAVYIGKELPGEYTLSQYSKNLRSNRTLSNAKNQAAQNLGELIEIAENPSWQENRKAKHAMDAKYGWWRYNTRFAIPGKSKYHIFDANLLIRHAADGKYYLYDVLGIKENRTSAEGYQVAIASQKGGSQGSASDNTIAQRATGVNNQSMQNRAEHASGTEAFYRLLDEQNAKLDADRSSRRKEKSKLRYSIDYTTDNRPVVIVDKNILDGVPRSRWVETVKNTLSDNFSDGIPVAGRLIKVNRTSRDEFTNSRDSQRYRKYNRDIYRDKFTSAGNLDEILLASTNYVNEDLNHRRKDNFKEFARGDVLLRIGNRDYSAKVIVGFTTGNQMVLYDVIDFTPTEIQLKKEGTHTAQPQSAKSSRNSVPSADGNTPPAFDTIIAQRAAGVNNQSMQNQAEHASETEEFYRLLDEQNARLDADRSSRRRRQYSLNEKFKDEYDAWDKKTEGRPFYIGNTSDALESVGVRDYGFYWDKSKIVKIKEKHPDMTDDVIKRVPEILENPVLIMESLTVPGRITLYGEVTDAKGIPVLVAVELNPSGKSGRILNMAKIASAYGRKGENATQSLIDRSTILYIDPNKNRTDNWSRALRLQLPTGLTSYGPINTIAQRATGVNNQSMQNQAEHAQPRRKFSVASQEDIENLRDGRYTEDRGEENGRQPQENAASPNRRVRYGNYAADGHRGVQEVTSADPGGERTSNQVRGRDGTAADRGTQKYGEVTLRYRRTDEGSITENARVARDGFAEYGINAEIVESIVIDRRGETEDFNRDGKSSAATAPDGKIFIYNNEKSDPKNVVAHELVHYMRRRKPEAFREIEDILKRNGVDVAVLSHPEGELAAEFIGNYEKKSPGFSMNDSRFREELLSFVSGWHAQDPEFARQAFGTFIRDYDAVVDAITSSLDRLKKAQAENSPQRENAGGSSVPETHVKYSKKENRASALAASNATIRPSEEGGQNPVDTSTIAQRATGVNHQSMQNQAEHAQPRRKFSAAEDTKNIENLRDGRYTEDKVEENGGQAERTPETAIEESWNYNEQTDRRRDKDNTGVRESGLRNHAGYLNRGPQESTALDEGRRTASEGLRNENRERFGEKETRTQNYRGMTLRYRPTSEAEVEGNARQARDGFAEYGIQAEIVDRIETDRGGGADDFNRSGNVSAATTPDGKILIYNTEGSSPENVVNHELVHYMRRNAPDLYQAMVNTLTDGGINASVVTRPEGQYVKQFINDYERLHPGISLDTPHFYEELLSYVSGLHAQDPEFARQVFGTFIRDYDAVVDAITSSLDRLKKAQAENSPQRENAGGSSVSETHVKYSVAEDGRLSRFFTSVLDSKNIPEDYKARIREDAKAFYYEVEHNEDTLKRAVDRVLEDPDRALARFLGKSPRQADRTDIAVGMVLQSNLLAQKDYAGAVDVTEKLQKIGTQAGQSVQAFTFLNRMTPNGMIYYVSSTLDKVYNELSRGMGRKAREKLRAELRLTPVEAEYIYSLMQAAGRLPPGRERDVALASVNEFVGAKIPARFRDKLKSWLRISMLLNPKTMIRNVMSNVLMYPVHIASDAVGTALDRAVQGLGKTGVRTTGLPDFRAQLSGARRGAFESFDDFRRHINTRGTAGRYEIRREGTPFNRQGGPLSRALAKVDSVTGFLLDAGDRPFFEAYFINSLNNQLRLNGAETPTADMVDLATREALERTWQDDNGFTKAFSSIRRVLNFGGDFGLGTIAVPFTKTPANLVKALVDFSPAGLIRGLTRDIVRLNRAKSNGEGLATAQRTLVRDVANGFVGTLLMMTGYVLAANGVVTGSGEDDRDAAAYSRDMMGISPYSFILGDGTSVTYDWAAPIGTLIGIGADIQKELDASRDSGDDFVGKLLGALGVAGTAAVVGANTLFEQSLFTGIRDLFGGTYGTIPEGILGTALNLPSQFVPTFLSQIAQALDPYQRVQYVKGNEFQSTLNEVLAKIPGLRGTLEIKRNNLGGYVNKNGGFTTVGAGASTILNTFLNPSNVNTKQPTELQKRLWALYEKTGNEAIFPSTAPDSFRNDGKTYVLSPQQKNRYLKAAGAYYTENAQRILDSHRSNEEKAAELADLVTKSRAYAKEEIIKIIEGEA